MIVLTNISTGCCDNQHKISLKKNIKFVIDKLSHTTKSI